LKTGTIHSIPQTDVTSKKTGEIFTLFRSITSGTSITNFSVMHEELLPGRRTSSPHAHSKKDELYIVLKGTPTAHVNQEPLPLQTGDYIIFEAGKNESHCLSNDTDETVELLTISSCPDDDVVTYTPI
jgi:uncharacterized cupin superfamily protein